MPTEGTANKPPNGVLAWRIARQEEALAVVEVEMRRVAETVTRLDESARAQALTVQTLRHQVERTDETLVDLRVKVAGAAFGGGALVTLLAELVRYFASAPR